jgi:hypothetical protein
LGIYLPVKHSLQIFYQAFSDHFFNLQPNCIFSAKLLIVDRLIITKKSGMSRVKNMLKKILLFFLAICIALLGISMAQEPAEANKNILMKGISAEATASSPSASSAIKPAQASAAVLLVGADLRPSLWVDCYSGDFEEVLAEKGFLFVKNIYVYVYNSGSQSSTSATGKIEFFDILTNRNIVFDFNVDPIAPKGWGNIRPRNSLSGPYIIRKDSGITASVTFRPTSTTAAKTKTSTQKACSILY